MAKIEAGTKFENRAVTTVRKGATTVSELISKGSKTGCYENPFEVPEPEYFAKLFA